LLDHYDGDVQKAIGAYNGGTVTPNLHYALVVSGIADYARRILEHAPVLTATDSAKHKTMNSPTPASTDPTADLPFRALDLPKL
jgi:soluble lytic murein transglycosylase-like protein